MTRDTAVRLIQALSAHDSTLERIRELETKRSPHSTAKKRRAERLRFERQIRHILGTEPEDYADIFRRARVVLGLQRSSSRDAGAVASHNGLAKRQPLTGGNRIILGGLPGSKR